MIKFTNVSKVYSDKTQSLSNINLTINKGEFLFVVGHSGAGKSTLLKLLLREEKATTGRLTILGEDLNSIKNRHLFKLRRNLGVVFQDFRLLQDKTAYENVEFALRVVGTKPKEIKPRVLEALKKVGLEDKAKKYPSELSGGECQRVAIARAIVNKPSIIIADECTGNLDRDNSLQIVKLLDKISSEGVTVIMATHDLELLKVFNKRTIALKHGKIIGDTKGDNYENN